MRVLIVDDSAQIRLVIQRYISTLNSMSFDFFHAENGNKAKQVLQENELFSKPIDLIFLDWHMPEMNGLSFLSDIRSVDKFKTYPPIIMLSAETYPQQIEACLKYGVSSYLTKPFTEEQIHEALKKVIHQLNGVGHAI
ncbi:MAG: response regulator [Bdellovibrionaceae bacterium]|nr:response regulator [Pseudobdellovibrionaceae bacterium]NUM58602.1 response regulator [Pseudobdellovibrionaceae bacterium]